MVNYRPWQAAAAFITMILAAAPTNALAEEASCRLNLAAELPLTFDSGNGRPIISVSTPTRELHLFVDLTSAFSALSEAGAEALGGRRAHPDLKGLQFTMGSHLLSETIRTPQLQLGRSTVDTAEFFIAPSGVHMPANIDGILASDILHLFDVELDVPRARLKLFSTDHCPGKVVYWTGDYTALPITEDPLHRVLFPVTINGTKAMAAVGTALSVTAIPRSIAHEKFGISYTPEGKACARTKTLAALGTLEIGDIEIHRPDINTDCDAPVCPFSEGQEPDIAIGMNHLKKFSLYISWKDKIIYFIPV